MAGGALAPCDFGDGGDQHQGQHHREVLDDQPADGDAAVLGLQQAALLQGAQQHHGARHRQRQAEDETGHEVPAQQRGKAHAHGGRDRDLHHRAGHGDGLHRQQVLEREMQADAEHQQDHADFRQLGGERLVGDEARRERPHRDTRQQIADQGRNPQAMRKRAEHESQHEAGDDGGDEGRVVHEGVRRRLEHVQRAAGNTRRITTSGRNVGFSTP